LDGTPFWLLKPKDYLKRMDEEVLYYLTTEDVQFVATENLDRELTPGEIDMIKDAMAERIAWYDAILYAILDKKLS
jgi:hypothetical protein